MDEAEIPYHIYRRLDGWHLMYFADGGKEVCSVIEHKNSYGHEEDTLEVSGLIVEPVGVAVKGGVTAEEVFAAIRQHRQEHNA